VTGFTHFFNYCCLPLGNCFLLDSKYIYLRGNRKLFMNTTLWIIQALLAGMFAMAGVMKSTQPVDKLLKSGVSWVDRFPLANVRLIGISEFLGAVGLVLPWLLNILPVLTPVAASGLAIVQLLAIFHHAKHKEGKAIVFNIVLFALAAFVAYGRFNGL
jgi:uncharacterized membrane protein YphA (DoxX/SURF4 family)